MPSELDRVIARYRDDLLAQDTAASNRISAVYEGQRAKIVRDIEALLEEITTKGVTSSTDAYELLRQSKLLEQLDALLTAMGRVAEPAIIKAQEQAIAAATAFAEASAIAQVPDGRASLDLAREWAHVNPRTVQDLVGQLSDGSPLRSLLQELAPSTSSKIEELLLEGITQGINSGQLAKRMVQATDLSHARAQAISRTSVLGAARRASLAEMQENDDIISGYEWIAALQPRTCLACLGNHGKIFPLDVPFQSHVNCRCTPVPVLSDYPMPPTESAQQWFNEQPEAFQKSRIPNALWDDFSAGKIRVSDFAHLHENPRWGGAYQVATVAQARANAKRR